MTNKKLSASAIALQDYLKEYLKPQNVKVRFNRNRSTYLSAVKKDGVYSISIHQVFAEAPEEVWKALGQFFVRATKKVRFELEQYINSLPSEVWQANTRRAPKLEPEGEHHHLNEALQRANELGFAGEYPRELPKIGWSVRSNQKKGLSRLGSYDDDAHLIRISFRLDDPEVPFDFIASIVFHELLHGIYRPEVSAERKRRVHTKDFLIAEKQYQHYAWARRWERAHLDKILKKQRRRVKVK